MEDRKPAKNLMTLSEYQELCKRTCVSGTREKLLGMCGLGLSGEVGEINDTLKKHLFHSHDLDLDHMTYEIGDVLWYLVMLCDTLDIPLSEVMEQNIEKLKRRYPERFSEERSQNRKDFEP